MGNLRKEQAPPPGCLSAREIALSPGLGSGVGGSQVRGTVLQVRENNLFSRASERPVERPRYPFVTVWAAPLLPAVEAAPSKRGVTLMSWQVAWLGVPFTLAASPGRV